MYFLFLSETRLFPSFLRLTCESAIQFGLGLVCRLGSSQSLFHPPLPAGPLWLDSDQHAFRPAPPCLSSEIVIVQETLCAVLLLLCELFSNKCYVYFSSKYYMCTVSTWVPCGMCLGSLATNSILVRFCFSFTQTCGCCFARYLSS